MNAEIVSRTVQNIDEAVEWLNYTYLQIRMVHNPLVYGLTQDLVRDDPQLFNRRRELCEHAAMQLQQAKMIKFDYDTGALDATDLGRTASYYYIKYDTINRFNEEVREDMEDDEILSMIVSVENEFRRMRKMQIMLVLLSITVQSARVRPVKGAFVYCFGAISNFKCDFKCDFKRDFKRDFKCDSEWPTLPVRPLTTYTRTLHTQHTQYFPFSIILFVFRPEPQSREEEMDELMDLSKKACNLRVPGGLDTTLGKVNILLQAYLSNYRLEAFSLISDSMFVAQVIAINGEHALGARDSKLFAPGFLIAPIMPGNNM